MNFEFILNGFRRHMQKSFYFYFHCNEGSNMDKILHISSQDFYPN